MLRKLWKLAGYAGLLLVVLALLAYLARDPLRDALVRHISTRVSKLLNGSLDIGHLRGSLVTSLVLQDVVLRDYQQNIVAQLDEVRLVYDLLTLLKGQVTLYAVDIVRPRLTLIEQPDGTWNISNIVPSPDAAATSQGGFPLAVVLAHVHLRDGDIALRTASLPGVQRVEALQVRLFGQMDRGGVRLQLQQLTAHVAPAQVDIRTLHGAVQGWPGDLRIDDLRFETATTVITVDGIVPGGKRPGTLAVHMQPFDVGEIGRLLHDDTLRGLVHLTLQAKGPRDAVQTQLYIRAEGGEVAFDSQMNLAATPPSYRGTLDIARLNLSTLAHRAALRSDLNARVHLDGAGVTPHQLRGKVRLDIQPSHLGGIAIRPSVLELEAQAQRFLVTQCTLDTSVARMTASGAVDLTGTSNLHYQVNAALPQLRQLLGVNQLDGTLQMQGQVTGELAALSARGTLQARNLRYQEHRLGTLNVQLAGSDLAAQSRQLTAQLEARQMQVSTLPVEQVEVQATYHGTEHQVRVQAQVRQSAEHGGQATGTVTLGETGQEIVIDALQVRLARRPWRADGPVQVALHPGSVQIKRFRLVHADEILEMAGALVGDQLQDVRVTANEIDLTALHEVVTLPEVVRGRTSVQVQLSGTLAQPVLRSAVSLRPVLPRGAAAQRLHATLAYEKQQLHADVRLRQGERDVAQMRAELPVDAAVTDRPLPQRLLDAPLAIRTQIQRPDLTALPHWLPGLPALTGTLQGDLTVQGSYTTLTLNTNLQLQQLGLPGSLDQVTAPVRLTGTAVTADSYQAFVQGLSQGRLALRVQNLDLSIATLHASLPGQGEAPPVQIENLVLQADARFGRDALEATLHNLRIQATIPGLPRADLTVAGRLTPQQVELSRLQVRLPQSEVRARGTLGLDTQQLRAQVDIPRLRLDELVPTLPATMPPEVRGVVLVQGSMAAPTVAARLQYAAADITADLTAHLQEPLPRYHATVQIKALPVAPFVRGAEGVLHAQLQVDGTGLVGEQRRVQVHLTMRSDQLRPLPGLQADLQASLLGAAINLTRLRLSSQPLTVNAHGSLSATRQVALAYDVTVGELQALREFLGLELHAAGGLQGSISGSLNALQAHGKLHMPTWKVAGLSGGDMQADFSVAQFPAAPQGTVQVQLASLQGPSLPKSTVKLEGTYAHPHGQFTFAVTAGPYANTQLAGHVALQEGVQLRLDRLHVHGPDLAWENVDAVRLVRDTHGTLQLFPLVLRSGAQAIHVQGTLTTAGSVEAAVQVRQLQLQPLALALLPDTTLPVGQFDAEVQFGGTLTQPRVQASASLTALRWQKADVGQVEMTFSLSDAVVRTDLRWHDQAQDLLRVQGTLSTDARRALDVHVVIPSVDMRRLAAMHYDVQHSAGTLDLDLRVQGSVEQPRPQGRLAWRDGALQLAATGERYRDIQAEVVFAGERIDIEQLRVGSRSGALRMSGWMTTAGTVLRQLDLSVQADQFTALNTSEKEAVISARLQAQGSMQDLAVTGKITVPQARLRLSGKLVGGPADVQPWELTVAGVYGPGREVVETADGQLVPRRKRAPLPFLRANVEVDIPKNAWAQGPGIAIEARGAMRVTKALQEPFLLSGTVETVRGFASFYGKKFLLQEGKVTFPGSEEINPFVDATVTHKVSDYVVTIHVGGKVQEPKITLSSTPELAQADIVSLLVTGKTTERLTASEQKTLSDRGQQLVGGVAAGQIQDTIGKPLGLDTVEVEAGEQLGTGRVEVGRYVTQDIFMSYEREVGGKGGNTVGIEYSINRRLKLKGSTSDVGETAVDLFWRHDY
jgi:autotransporter translocation and assembly factor TamB